MSAKQKARMAAKRAVGQAAKVNKVHGQLIVLRAKAKGRERDWRRTVKKLISNILLNWKVTDEDQGVVVFSKGKP
jgi:hypothetical protein